MNPIVKNILAIVSVRIGVGGRQDRSKNISIT